MSKHYIFGDTHHGSHGVVEYLKKKAGNGQIGVSSTGDFYCYDANSSRPEYLKHAWTEAYKKGDKEGMKKHEASWAKEIAMPYTAQSGEKLKELKPHLKGGKVQAILGNSDYAINDTISKYGGSRIHEMLGGNESAVNHISEIELKKDGKTTFVYMPHNIQMLSQHKGKDYKTVKKELAENSEYQAMLESIAKQIDENGSENVAVLVHEAPAPERWYKDKAKVESRLPSPLKAHYDSVLEKIAQKGKKTTVFHGHLHEGSKKSYNYKGMDTRLLDIGDIVTYDTDSGQYSVEHVQPAPKGQVVKMDQYRKKQYEGKGGEGKESEGREGESREGGKEGAKRKGQGAKGKGRSKGGEGQGSESAEGEGGAEKKAA